jgi:hypothetical protein
MWNVEKTIEAYLKGLAQCLLELCTCFYLWGKKTKRKTYESRNT